MGKRAQRQRAIERARAQNKPRNEQTTEFLTLSSESWSKLKGQETSLLEVLEQDGPAPAKAWLNVRGIEWQEPSSAATNSSSSKETS